MQSEINVIDHNTDKRILILAEKRSVANSIARALSRGLGQSYQIVNQQGYMIVRNFYITWASGHLLQLATPGHYDPRYNRWDLGNHPIIISKYQYTVPHKNGKTIRYLENQLNNIVSLVTQGNIDIFVMATDYDREGQLIGEEIFRLFPPRPTYRLFLNEWTPTEIIDKMKHLIDNQSPEPRQLAIQAFNRQYIDWLIGMNYTPMFSLHMRDLTSTMNVYNIGRVILPTLKMLYDRNEIVEQTKHIPYLNIVLPVQLDNLLINTKLREIPTDRKVVFHSQDHAQAMINQIDYNDLDIKLSIETKKKYPPQLFCMTSLQRHMLNKSSRITSTDVSNALQKLYEKGIISYPRTVSRHLEKNMFGKVFGTVRKMTNGELKANSTPRVFNDSRVKSHGAIIPTGNKPDKLSWLEEQVYNEIVERFLSQFGEIPLVNELTVTAYLTKGELKDSYYFKGTATQYLNTQPTVDTKAPKVKEWPPTFINNSTMAVGTKDYSKTPLQLLSFTITEDKVRPRHYTEATLLTDMEYCGENVLNTNDPKLDEFSLGTPATRDSIIQKLKYVGYVDVSGPYLIISPKGRRVIEHFPDKDKLEARYAGDLEVKISQAQDFGVLKEIEQEITQVTDKFRKLKNVNLGQP